MAGGFGRGLEGGGSARADALCPEEEEERAECEREEETLAARSIRRRRPAARPQRAAAQGPSSRWRTGGWLEVEGETDVWGPHVSEWRNRNSRGVLVYTGDVYAYSGLAVGLGTHKT